MPSTSQGSSIAATLRDEILRGQYRCGERLPSERDLAQRFDVHRSTIREAFKRLEQLGVAKIQPGGARVAPLHEASLDIVEHLLALDDSPDPEILDHALEAVSGFRAMAARLGTERADASQRARLLEIVEQIRALIDAGNEDEIHADLANELGDCFVEASGNTVLQMMRRGLRPPPSVAEVISFMELGPEERAEIAQELSTLARAIQDADGVAASEATYGLSVAFRRKVREQSKQNDNAPVVRQAASGGRR